ncbi:transcription-repair coupling factor [Defluviitalea phaphyphila]|uniref:transcription-repair coupling factor n=1 Tax=Defluviitalea phaphyphila TaxID=1473580 RepID=UPI000AD720A6|nr:transcription-repair coupling factor [Defluviitalea phaphyphila]
MSSTSLNAIIDPILELEAYKKLLNNLKSHKSPILATGTIDSQKSHLIYAIKTHTNRPIIIVTHNEMKAKEIYEDMKFFIEDNIYIYPSKDVLFYNADVHSIDIVVQRLNVLKALIDNKNPVIILSIEALLDRLVKKDIFTKFILKFKVGDIVSIKELTKNLVLMGYEHSEIVESPGQFSLRGGIIDVYSSTSSNPYRIEFWDDEIDSIRSVDPITQRSIDKEQEIEIFPMREVVFEEEMIKEAINAIEKESSKNISKLEKQGLNEEKAILENTVNNIIEKLKNEKNFQGIEGYIKYFYKDTVTLTEYLDKDTIFLVDEPIRIKEKCNNVIQEFEDSMKERLKKGYILPRQMEAIFRYEDILYSIEPFDKVLMTMLTQSIKDFTIKEVVNFSVKPINSFYNKLDILEKDILFWKQRNFRIVILCGPKSKGDRLKKELAQKNIESSYKTDLSKPIQKGEVVIYSGSLHKGFEYGLIDFVVISDKEVFGEEKKKRKSKKKVKGKKIEVFTDLKVGDYVVHENHGIGIYQGIEKIVVDNVSKDYLKIKYLDNGILYVPINQMDIVQKYIGREGKGPKLNKLGGSEWIKAKAKVKKAVADLAKELIELYAKRQKSRGYKYGPDTVWQKEFEDMFPYEETADQIKAIEEVKKDLESDKIMDRLLCGDVGYGKTEVAIRAAFKVVQEGKQVAYLVPTTILAQQHYNTFVQRMKDFPIKIGVLSRFRTPKEQRQTIEGLKRGIIDIVIGTHRLLSKDIMFKDLGLLIVDEEQRFGVAHKEKLKHLKENVDVLTLTATPIPRTLHMSLVGIRDMSILEEPPEERYPVQTYVMEYNPEFIRDAINREIGRNGQVYYLYNRVKNIDKVAAQIQKLVPEAVVSYAHGQMSERELENIMVEFINGKIDVLVCTTIIETGLDIPNVNTIIIQDADCMGLSQLYQLRGRVGRSNRIAYAYLMYQKDKVLQEGAEKRLQAIKEFTEFGSGFKIAMRDLEIRGAGNILGAQQHGHMDAVGYDLYCKLLEEAVSKESGQEVKENFETSIDLNISAYIPSAYIQNEMQKLEIYKKIATIQNEKDYFDLQEEIEDRYGDLPKSVQNLLDISLLKAEAHDLEILSITQKGNNINLTFKEDAHIDPTKISEILSKYKKNLKFVAVKTPYFIYSLKNEKKESLIRYIKNLLHDLKGLKLK